jgi:hypothetical protein
MFGTLVIALPSLRSGGQGSDLLIMDALPRNVLTLEDGNLMPFDVVIVRPSQSLKSRLGL